jgi:hypothetical protein
MASQPLTTQFVEAQSNVNLGTRRLVAMAAHSEVRAELNRCSPLVEHDLVDVLIGSYARNTGIWPGKDVDILAKLTSDDIESIRPEMAYNLCLEALRPRYEGRLTEQPRSIKIDFGPADDRAPEEQYLRKAAVARSDVFNFSVDVVPAVRCGDIWAIPSRQHELWQRTSALERWVLTDPERLTELTVERNKEPMISGQGAFVPTVKAVRQIRQAHLGDAKPGGLYFELIIHQGFSDGAVTGDTWADLTASALTFVSQRLRTTPADPLCDPVLGEPYAPAPDSSALARAASVFEQLAVRAAAALNQDKCPAAAAWREVFGDNGNGPVFPLPAGCRADGSIMVPGAAANTLSGSDEARGFGAT